MSGYLSNFHLFSAVNHNVHVNDNRVQVFSLFLTVIFVLLLTVYCRFYHRIAKAITDTVCLTEGWKSI